MRRESWQARLSSSLGGGVLSYTEVTHRARDTETQSPNLGETLEGVKPDDFEYD
jgi:hypothetical protein